MLKPCLLLSMVKSSLKVSWTSFIPIPHRTELAYCPPCSQTHHQIDNRRGYAQLFFIYETISRTTSLYLHYVYNFIDKSFLLVQFIEKLLDEGVRSPRTIRLAALHLTGLWLSHPKTLKYYIKELKLLSLYGSGTSILIL